MLDALAREFGAVAPRASFWSLRLVEERDEYLSVRRDVVQPVSTSHDIGVMVCVAKSGGVGYAGTCDLSSGGLRRAGARALAWAERGAADGLALPPPRAGSGRYETPVVDAWETTPTTEKIDRLLRASAALGRDDRVLDWEAGLWHTAQDTGLVTADGGRIEQRFRFLLPTLSATAHGDGQTLTRTFGHDAYARQRGLELLDEVAFDEAAHRIAREVVELLRASDCPSGRTDVLLAPDQMILQLHESIGHPLELDRILGDERNYAGTSFVRPEMFGSYRYGSPLLNVTFEPAREAGLASYEFDDDGQPAERAHLIRDGLLLRGLGGATSQLRSGLPGVSNARADGWNRPPIDRMANLDLEPGDSTFAELVAGIENGVYMETNCSWSIDDARNKFQFGCERGRLIRDGELGPVVRKPNYRGISATFWRNLRGVGDASTLEVLGTPYCGKGEPNQAIRVGHSAPACWFRDVDVFGGD